MKNQKLLLTMAFIAIIGISFNSCDKDDDTPVTGEALFEYAIDGYEVTFTNKSDISGTVTYAWDFGDSKGTSDKKDPVYTYESKGEYTVVLTVTDEQSGTHPVSTKIAVDKSTPIKLDDNSFDDWATITEGFTPGANAGNVLSFKFDYDSEDIYFYLKITNSVNYQIYDMLIDVDPGAGTGYAYDIWPMFEGAELLIEGGFTDDRDNEEYWMTFAPWNPDGTEWDDGDTDESIWPINEDKQTDDYRMDGTFKLSGSYIEMEFSISRINIDALKNVEVVKVVGWTSDADWEENGWIDDKNPGDNSNPNAGGITIDMR